MRELGYIVETAVIIQDVHGRAFRTQEGRE